MNGYFDHNATTPVRAEVRELEAELRVPLLDRSVKGVQATPAGEALAHHARALLQQVNNLLDLARIDSIGGPTSIPHYPRGFAMACGTPFRLYKINAHAGGHQVPFIVAGPASSIDPCSLKSIARRVLPSRLALNRFFGSLSEAPFAKVVFTAFL